MKIAISYPPLESKKGAPTLSQNRQFQWFKNPTYIYPVILASAATLLKKNGYEVFWDDAIAEGLSYSEWLERIIREKPDIVVIETKTPVVKRHWKIINQLKNLTPSPSPYKGEGGVWLPKIVLAGDHAAANPQESLENSPADYILAHGDWDFGILNLVNHLDKKVSLSGGVYYKNSKGEIANSGPVDISQNNLDNLPLIDRELTHWELYGYKNGNFKRKPGAYMMSARDCWWGKCSFCAWTILFPGEKYRCISSQKALDEVGSLIRLGAKEIMEDSGTLPIGKWLFDFCQGMIERGFNKKVAISCNMRLNAIKNFETWKLMKKAGFRMILFGLESANQKTLDRVNKGLKTLEIEPALGACKKAGLEAHLTVMVGYPWEKKRDIEKTYNFVKKLVNKNLLSSLQATLAIPYPGTELYNYCKSNNLLKSQDYEKYDQSQQVMKTDISDNEMKKMIKKFYRLFLSPRIIFRRILAVRNWEDARFLVRSGIKVLFG